MKAPFLEIDASRLRPLWVTPEPEKLKRDIHMLVWIGLAVGAVCFLLLYGWQVLDVRYEDWLFGRFDVTQQYLGWMGYRNSSLPGALTDQLNYPYASSVLYTDSIPLIAIGFRGISFLLPETFQYFGIWGLFCFLLNGATAAVLIRSFSSSKLFCAIGSLFFIFSPLVLFRMFIHSALAAQGLMLVAFCFWFYKPFFSTFRQNLWGWCALFGFTIFIHPYFIPPIGLLFSGYLLDVCLDTKTVARQALLFFAAVATTLCGLWWMGAMADGVSTAADGLGRYSANLNFLFNPININVYDFQTGISRLFKPLASTIGQYEGSGYLGAGMFFLGIMTAIKLCVKKYRFPIRRSALILCGVLLLLVWLAVAPVITFGARELCHVPYPLFLTNLLSIFRASGRFVWPLCYFLFAFFLFVVQRKSRPVVALLLVCAGLGLQIVDFSGWMRDIHRNFTTRKTFVSELQSDLWPRLAQRHQHLFYTGIICWLDNRQTSIVKYALEHGLTLNFFALIRPTEKPVERLHSVMDAALRGEIMEETLYVLANLEEPAKQALANAGMLIYEVDGITIGLKHPLTEMPPPAYRPDASHPDSEETGG